MSGKPSKDRGVDEKKLLRVTAMSIRTDSTESEGHSNQEVIYRSEPNPNANFGTLNKMRPVTSAPCQTRFFIKQPNNGPNTPKYENLRFVGTAPVSVSPTKPEQIPARQVRLFPMSCSMVMNRNGTTTTTLRPNTVSSSSHGIPGLSSNVLQVVPFTTQISKEGKSQITDTNTPTSSTITDNNTLQPSCSMPVINSDSNNDSLLKSFSAPPEGINMSTDPLAQLNVDSNGSTLITGNEKIFIPPPKLTARVNADTLYDYNQFFENIYVNKQKENVRYHKINEVNIQEGCSDESSSYKSKLRSCNRLAGLNDDEEMVNYKGGRKNGRAVSSGNSRKKASNKKPSEQTPYQKRKSSDNGVSDKRMTGFASNKVVKRSRTAYFMRDEFVPTVHDNSELSSLRSSYSENDESIKEKEKTESLLEESTQSGNINGQNSLNNEIPTLNDTNMKPDEEKSEETSLKSFKDDTTDEKMLHLKKLSEEIALSVAGCALENVPGGLSIKPLSQWTINDAQEWIFNVTKNEEVKEKFLNEEIDGSVLKFVSFSDLVSILNLRFGPAKKLEIALKAIQAFDAAREQA